MPDGVLYFPYMRVPADAWFTRVLLYWDRIGVIVPSTHVSDKPMLGAYTETLIGQGLVAAVSPDEHYLPGLARGFLQVMEADRDTRPEHSHSEVSARDWTHIHVSKMGVELFRELEERRLARREMGREGPFWYEVEPQTASLFMAYLAVVLGQLEGISPITDDPRALAVLDREHTGIASPLAGADRLQLGLIEGILPAPEGPVAVDEMIRFKSDNAQLLNRLRGRVEAAVLDAINDIDADVRARRLELVRRDLQLELDEVREQMQRRRWPRVVFGGICGVGAAAASLATVATGGLLLPTVIAVPSFVSGVYAALGDFNGKDEMLRSPLAYAALAHAKFGNS